MCHLSTILVVTLTRNTRPTFQLKATAWFCHTSKSVLSLGGKCEAPPRPRPLRALTGYASVEVLLREQRWQNNCRWSPRGSPLSL
jgi:hypothetical protein